MAVPDRLLNRIEVADRLHVSEATVRRLCQTGHLIRVQVSARMWRVPESSVEAHIASRTTRCGGGADAD